MTEGTAGGRGLHVALYSGIYVHNDAISNSLHHKVEILRFLRNAGLPVTWTVFAQASDYDDEFVRVVSGPAALVCEPDFWAADVHVFEFGIAYDLFNAVFLIPPDKSAVAVYHNVTPLHLVTSETTAAAVERSELQRFNLFLMEHVANVSEFNLRGLEELGIPGGRLSVLHLPPALDAQPSTRPRPHLGDGPLRLLFVGRMVSSKGVLDLVEAVENLVESGHDVRLTLVGNLRLSDPAVLAELERRSSQVLASHMDLRRHVDGAELVSLYREADVLVMPSYHEGYCVTVVEALAMGCFVVAYDAGNLPNVVGRVGQLVPTGDVPALQTCLALLADRVSSARKTRAAVVWPTVDGDIVDGEWLGRVARHNLSYDRAQYNQGFLGLLARAAESTVAGVPLWLSERAQPDPVIA